MDPFYYADLYALVLMLALVSYFLVRAWRGGVRGRRLAVGTWAYLFGTFITVMLSFHVAENLWRITPGTLISHGDKPGYDFRFYSLILFGVVMLVQGVSILKASKAIAFGDDATRSTLIRRTLVVLALCVPIIPFQIFGAVLTVMGVMTLSSMMLVRERAVEPKIDILAAEQAL